MRACAYMRKNTETYTKRLIRCYNIGMFAYWGTAQGCVGFSYFFYTFFYARLYIKKNQYIAVPQY